MYTLNCSNELLDDNAIEYLIREAEREDEVDDSLVASLVKATFC